jgi:HD-GYP domain-containing protein (c-di-GMP phosphodiesterase class II)
MKQIFVSSGVPDFTFERTVGDDISFERITSFSKYTNSKALRAYLLDTEFIKKHKKRIQADCLPGTVIIWNPDGEELRSLIKEELVFQEIGTLSTHTMIERTFRNLFKNLQLQARIEEQRQAMQVKDNITKELLNIGIALSAERDNDTLLDLILLKSREITKADAGSLYLLVTDEETGEKNLLFKIAHNDSNPTDFTEFKMPLNTKSIAGYVAVNKEAINIKDAYRIPKRQKISFNKSYDEATGYRTKSILTVPMLDHKEKIIGVIQLINRKKDFSKKLSDKKTVNATVEPFNSENESLVRSLASQAAVSLENNRLYDEIEALFEGFVRAASKAIESRDPTTSGHSNRVAALTVELARAVDKCGKGEYKDVHFSTEQIKELRYASLLHDFGKVGVREHVLVKAQKLYAFQLELIRVRFAYIIKAVQSEMNEWRFEYFKEHGEKAYQKKEKEIAAEEQRRIEEIKEYMQVVIEANEPKLLEENPAHIIDEIAQKTYYDLFEGFKRYLSDDEYAMLRIKKGSLSEEERKEIESHVIHSYEFLKKIPWTSSMQMIPDIARWHHERLDGGGYPDGISGENIPLQSRMMTIADIFDALTAQDRPYKKAVPVDRALKILQGEAELGYLDKALVDIFVGEKVYEKSSGES